MAGQGQLQGEMVILQAQPPALCLGLYVQLRSLQHVRPISPGALVGSILPLSHSANACRSFTWCQKWCWVLGAECWGKGTAVCVGVRVCGCTEHATQNA